MATLKYIIIKSKTQYKEYCKILEKLLESKPKSKNVTDEIELLTVLIEMWDTKYNSFEDNNPIEILQYLMAERNMKPNDLVKVLNVSKSLVSEILSCKKGISKQVVRKLAEYFKVSQEIFNRTYVLKSPYNSKLKNSRVMNTKKEFA